MSAFSDVPFFVILLLFYFQSFPNFTRKKWIQDEHVDYGAVQAQSENFHPNSDSK